MSNGDHHAPAMRTLLLAADLCGGSEMLAARLGVAEGDLYDWLAGDKRPPNEVFLQALDIVAAGPLGQHAVDTVRAQARADRIQAAADRVQASADRLQKAADRAQEMADRSRSAGDTRSGVDEVQRIADRSKRDPTSSTS